MENAEKQRLLRQITAALVSSKLSISELERFRKIVMSDPSVLDMVFESAIGSIKGLMRPQESHASFRSENDRLRAIKMIDDVHGLVSMGLLSKESIVQAIERAGVLELSASTMRRMSTRNLVERAIADMSRLEAKKFLEMLASIGSEDSYLKGIERKRGV